MAERARRLRKAAPETFNDMPDVLIARHHDLAAADIDARGDLMRVGRWVDRHRHALIGVASLALCYGPFLNAWLGAWAGSILFLCLPGSAALGWVWRRREARIGRLADNRAREGQACGVCGYDLRGTPGDRCGECGTASRVEVVTEAERRAEPPVEARRAMIRRHVERADAAAAEHELAVRLLLLVPLVIPILLIAREHGRVVFWIGFTALAAAAVLIAVAHRVATRRRVEAAFAAACPTTCWLCGSERVPGGACPTCGAA